MAEKAEDSPDLLLIPHKKMEDTFFTKLQKQGFAKEKAETCARIFMENSLDGVYSHGVNRFSRFIEYIQKGYVNVHEEAVHLSGKGAIEQWDGRLGPGPLNAILCTERSMKLARMHGMGCVALSNTNHWMRGGTYGWKAAKEGFIFICWTNTLANMPAWGAKDNKIGNNPLVLAAPYGNEAIVLDMALSQFSYGTLEEHKLNKDPLSFPAGYDKEGNLSKDPEAVLETGRILPAGYWKGAGLSLLLDILATLLSGGLSTAEISKKEAEYGVSQVFIAIDTAGLHNHRSIKQLVQAIIRDYHSSTQAEENKDVRFPGEGSLRTRLRNLERGIPVNQQIWEKICKL